MSDPADTFNEKVSALRRHYLEQLPSRVAQIDDTWKALTAGDWNPTVCKSLERMVHQLTGSAGSFGLDALSAAARSLDSALKGIVSAGAVPSSQQRAGVEELLPVLRGAASAAEHNQITHPSFSGLREARPTARAEPSEGERRIIFLVEDDLLQAQELALQVGYFGYDVRVFAQLSELRAALSGTTPAALIMDIVFSEGDLAGAETVAELQLTREQTIPVVFTSVRTDLPARLKAVQAGGGAYFPKPLNTSELVERLDELTGREIPDPYRVLIIDDSRTTAAYHSAILEQAGMLTDIVTDPLSVMRPLVDFKPDMLLMDMHMPVCTGAELAKVLRQQKAYYWLPIIFLSAESELDKQLAVLNESGGDVFLTKPIEPQHLISVATSRVERSRTLRSLMIRDSLTELYNHTTLKESLEHELAQAKRRKAPLAYTMLDIDHFKAVNDVYGHGVGDHVLKSLARLLRQRLRKSDVVGRYGGEEFAAIFPNTTEADAARVLDELRETFAQIRFRPVAQADFSVTFSGGVASFPGWGEAAELTEAADRALYEAKRLGRNRVLLAEA